MISKESVRISVTLPKKLHSKIVAIANKESRSIAATIKVLTEEAIATRNKKD